jgi:hypothetical protein
MCGVMPWCGMVRMAGEQGAGGAKLVKRLIRG